MRYNVNVVAQFMRDAALNFLFLNGVTSDMSEYRQVLSLPRDRYCYLGSDGSFFYFSGSELEYVFWAGSCDGWLLGV